MKILFDTNIILDVMLLREPFLQASALLLAEVERKTIGGFLCSTTVTTIHYLFSKSKGDPEAKKQIKKILQLFEVAQVDKAVLESALDSKFTDYEDSVLHQSAIKAGLNGIVTRNTKDFRRASLPVYDPVELYKLINSLN